MSSPKTAMKTNETFLAELAAVRSALETWRRTRTHRRPIPPEIWEQVVPLARTHGVSRVSEALRLNYYALKRRLGAPKRARRRSGSTSGPSFVEVKRPGWADTPSGSVVEVEDRMGRKMKLRLAEPGGVDTVALVQAFWKAGR